MILVGLNGQQELHVKSQVGDLPFGNGKAWSDTDLLPWKPLKALDSGPARELADGAMEGAPPPLT